MRFVLYNHVGSANHGCEALVRTVSHMLGEKNTVLLSDAPDEEKEYGITDIIDVFPSESEKGISPVNRLYSYFKLKVEKNYFYMDILPFKPAIDKLNSDDVLVSIGGDIFCYENYPKYNLLHQYALKRIKHSILIGCSIEPELLEDDALLEDLRSFELISAREHITFDALKNNGLNNAIYCPDSAFCLPVCKTDLPSAFIPGNTVGINISPLFLKKANDPALILDNLRTTVSYILNHTTASVAFIPHVAWKNNDDREPLKKLYDEFSLGGRVCYVEDQDARKLKWIISQCSCFIGARTHATIAAYSTGVPTLALGYSVKSRGIARDLFGTEENFVLSYQDISSQTAILDKYRWITENAQSIKAVLSAKIPAFQQKIIETGNLLKRKYVVSESIKSNKI